MDWSVLSDSECPEKELQVLITLSRKGKEGHLKAMNISAAGAKCAMTLTCTPLCDVSHYRAWENPEHWIPSLYVKRPAMQKREVPPLRTAFVLMLSAKKDSLWALQITHWNHPSFNLSHITSLFSACCQPEGFLSLRSDQNWRLNTGNFIFPIQGILHKCYLANNSYKSCEIIDWVSL